MDTLILQFIGIFIFGFVAGLASILLFNKLRSGSVSANGVKQEYDEYKNQVEAHFEETSKKFQEMTEQYQDLYQHLAVGATSLCRPDSVAASLADSASSTAKLENKPEDSDEQLEETVEGGEKVAEVKGDDEVNTEEPQSTESEAQEDSSKP